MLIFLATPETMIRRIVIESQSDQNVSETPISINKLGMVVYARNHIYLGRLR
jgi:hypothetical protein